MSKYTVEVKLQAVARYLTGNESYKTIAESIGADKSQVINWVKLFEAQGERGFKKGYSRCFFPMQKCHFHLCAFPQRLQIHFRN